MREVGRRLELRGRQRVAVTALRWTLRNLLPSARHGLSSELIVSLTSYQARFATLAFTLQCLLTQSIKPDRVILWLTQEDCASLPTSIRILCSRGLEIRETKDLRSYNKIIPALHLFPNATIVTADDDVFYGRHWLRALIRAWDGSTSQIVCHRAHRVVFKDGVFAPYGQWQHNIVSNDDPRSLFPTGVGGVLYPSGALAAEVMDEKAFLALAPFADDLWLYWMGRRAGSSYKVVGNPWKCVVWPASQKTALYSENRKAEGNDAQIANLLKAYGLPF